MAKQHWLMKSEPGTYSIHDLARDGTTEWDGVRNYQARNMMRDQMQVGDPVLFYHSNADPPGVAGIARVSSAPHADESAFDKKSKYYDARSTPEKPVWMLVDIEHVETLPRVVALAELRANPKLADMRILQRGNRLSITPVTRAEFDEVRRMAKRAPVATADKKTKNKTKTKKKASRKRGQR